MVTQWGDGKSCNPALQWRTDSFPIKKLWKSVSIDLDAGKNVEIRKRLPGKFDKLVGNFQFQFNSIQFYLHYDPHTYILYLYKYNFVEIDK